MPEEFKRVHNNWYIGTALTENPSYLVSRFGVGRKRLDRRVIKATGNTTLEFWQRVKIESAKNPN